VKVCPGCAHENADDARFCSQCATSLESAAAAREERKVVTCLFCDLVGFTARAETLDPEDVRRVLQPYHQQVRAELERFGGTVEKFIGDAVMAVFGAPVAHEDDPERAVRAALAIRDQLTEEGALEVRIGITTGEALVSLGARPEAGEGMASGDVVNTAARLQSAAPVNGILVDETTLRATERVISYREAAPIDAKGKTAPVVVFEAIEATSRFGVDVRQLGRSELVGRDEELDALVSALRRARREREPQLVTLVGVPGIGKSRLVWELFQHVDGGQELTSWRQGRSLPYGEGVSFWALGEMVKAQAGILETESSEQAEAKLRAAVEAVAGDEDPRWLERHLRVLVGLEGEGGSEDRRTEAFTAWRRFFEALAEERPLILVFEDLHWADDALLDFVDHLVGWASGVPIFVVGTARPELLERRSGWGGGKPNAVTLSLSPLSDEQTADLVHALLDSPVLDADTRTELLARAGGNPLYAEEFARLVAAGRALGDLPESVQGLIAARLDGLTDPEKTLLQATAVAGTVFWLGAAALVAGVPRWTAEELLHSLERKQFVRRERRSSVAGEDEYAFRHLLIRDVAYGQIPRAERGEKHRLAAEWIASLGRPEDHAELVAQHYLAALELANATDQPAAELAQRAGDALIEGGNRATGLTAFATAARLYEHALELLPDHDSRRPELLLRFGRALQFIADERAEGVLEDAAQALLDVGTAAGAAHAHVLLGSVWWSRGKHDRAVEHLSRAQELIGAEPSEIRAQVLARSARIQAIAGNNEEAVSAATEAIAIAERLALDDVRAYALASLGMARFRLGDPSWLSDFDQSIEIALGADTDQAANVYANLGFTYVLAGDVRRDHALREKAARIAERFGDVRTLRFNELLLPESDYYSGEWDRALAGTNSAIETFEAGSPHHLEPNIRWTRALIHHARGQEATVLGDVLLSIDRARETQDQQLVASALAVRLHLAIETAQIDDAAEVAREILAGPASHGVRPPAIDLAQAAEVLGNADEVRAWVGRIAYDSRWTDAALAILDGALGQAADVFFQIGSLPDEALARLRTREPENVQRALAFYRSVGATRYITECEELLGDASEIPA
jgi:class 3 adenylate cyclase/tetratricopeptide (TPR) repeat protein